MKHDKEMIRRARQLARKECANWQDGICLPDGRPCGVINPRYNTVHDGCIDCDWFDQAVLPLDPEFQTAYWHEIFREENMAGGGWIDCLRCHKSFVPRSNRQRYCKKCGTAVSRASNRRRQRRFRARQKSSASITI